MSDVSSVVHRFPTDELTINRLHARDTGFRALCDDHATALRAISHWEAQGPGFAARVEEYRQLLGEIEGEIEAVVAANAPPGPDGARGGRNHQRT